MTHSEPQERMSEKFVSFLIVFCLLIPILAAFLFQKPVHVPVCAASEIGNVVSDRKIDGRLVFVTGAFAVRAADNEERFIAHCSKGGCDRLYPILKQEKNGRPVHAEFCGKFLTLVSLEGRPIHTALPPTQTLLNEAASRGRMVGIFLLLAFLVLLLCTLIFRKRKEAT